jgi:hypothetical protein
MFGNRLLSRIVGPKEKEVTGGWRELYCEDHHLYSKDEIGVACSLCERDEKLIPHFCQMIWKEETS